MNKTRQILITTFFIIIYVEANAQIITDRPDQTESSSTIPKGALQLESGILIDYEGNNEPLARKILLPSNLFRYGISKWIELRLLNQFEMIKIANQSLEGLSDLEVGTKIQLLNKEDINTEIAFLTHLVLPTGSSGLTKDKYGNANKLSISHSINEEIGIGYNIGYNYFGEGNGDFTYSMALGIEINEKVGVYVEPFGEILNMEDFKVNFDNGVTYLANKNLQLDFSFGTGINQKMNYFSIGASWLMNKK